MNRPFARDQIIFSSPDYGRSAHGARELPAALSLLGARVWRGLRRQAPTIAAAWVLVSGVGLSLEAANGAELTQVIGLWGPLGLGVALAVAAVREIGRNTLTSLTSLTQHRGFAVLGAAPELTRQALRQLPPNCRTPLGMMTLEPSSLFAASFRNLQAIVAADQVVAFIAPAVNDGATTTALCAAIGAAQQGRRVIIVDCDLRRRSLTRAFGREPEAGVLEAAAEPQHWRRYVDYEDESGLPFMPAAGDVWRTLFGEPGFERLLEELRCEFDLVVLDCPPGAADGAPLARMADRCIIVARWDATPLNALRGAVRTLAHRANGTTGIYVNRTPPHYDFERDLIYN